VLTAITCRYELCAWLGLYVIDEANLETHGFDPAFMHDDNHPAHHAMWLPAIMARVTRMYERDKNAPAVIMWSLGNEAGYGVAHDAAAAWLRRRDSSRPVHYEVSSILYISAFYAGNRNVSTTKQLRMVRGKRLEKFLLVVVGRGGAAAAASYQQHILLMLNLTGSAAS